MVAGRQTAEAGTSHFVAVDRWGEVASLTSTIESGFGSGLVVNGYYLNNELTDFNFVPVTEGVGFGAGEMLGGPAEGVAAYGDEVADGLFVLSLFYTHFWG